MRLSAHLSSFVRLAACIALPRCMGVSRYRTAGVSCPDSTSDARPLMRLPATMPARQTEDLRENTRLGTATLVRFPSSPRSSTAPMAVAAVARHTSQERVDIPWKHLCTGAGCCAVIRAPPARLFASLPVRGLVAPRKATASIFDVKLHTLCECEKTERMKSTPFVKDNEACACGVVFWPLAGVEEEDTVPPQVPPQVSSPSACYIWQSVQSEFI